jgi:hypothetical protein
MNQAVPRCVAERIIGERIVHVTTTPSGEVLWLGQGTMLHVLSRDLAPVRSFALGTSGSNVGSLAASPTALAITSSVGLELWTLDGRCVAELDAPKANGVAPAVFTSDGETLVWCRSTSEPALVVDLLDARTGRVSATHRWPLAEWAAARQRECDAILQGLYANTGVESCTALPIGARGVLVAGWEGDGEHANVVARVDARGITPLSAAEGFGVIGASSDVALLVPHGEADLHRLDLASGAVTPWLDPSDLLGPDGWSLEGFEAASEATLLDERRAIVATEHGPLVLLDVGADDGAPALVRLDAVSNQRRVRRLGPSSFLTIDEATLRRWEL